jgi:tetratricopeptide (TPR) repeat protein
MPVSRLAVLVLALVLSSCSGGSSETDQQELADLFVAQAADEPTTAVSRLSAALEGVSGIDVERHRELQRWLNRSGADMKAVAAAYRTYAASHPGEPGAHYLSGRLLEGEAVITAFRKALEVDPDFAWGHRALGLASLAQDDSNAAVDHLEKALAAKPEWTDLYYRLGQAWYAHSDWKKAIRWFKQDLALLDPQNEDQRSTWLERGLDLVELQLRASQPFDQALFDQLLNTNLDIASSSLIRIGVRVNRNDIVSNAIERFWKRYPEVDRVVLDQLVSADAVYVAVMYRDLDWQVTGVRVSRTVPPVVTDTFGVRKTDTGYAECVVSDLGRTVGESEVPDPVEFEDLVWQVVGEHSERPEYLSLREKWLDFIRWPEDNR